MIQTNYGHSAATSGTNNNIKNKVNLKLKVTDLRSCGHHDQSPGYLAFYRAADSELTLGEIGRYRHQLWGVGYFKNTKNLFIHIARIPIGDSPRDIPTF